MLRESTKNLLGAVWVDPSLRVTDFLIISVFLQSVSIPHGSLSSKYPFFPARHSSPPSPPATGPGLHIGILAGLPTAGRCSFHILVPRPPLLRGAAVLISAPCPAPGHAQLSFSLLHCHPQGTSLSMMITIYPATLLRTLWPSSFSRMYFASVTPITRSCHLQLLCLWSPLTF